MSNSKKILTRISLGTLMIVLLAGLFAVDISFYQKHISSHSSNMEILLANGLIVQLIVAFIAILLTLELSNFAKATGASPFSALIAIAAFVGSFTRLNDFIKILTGYNIPINVSTLICSFLIILFLAQILRGDTIRAGANIAWSLFIVIYAGFLFSYISSVRAIFGPFALIIMISAVKGADIGAYFTGTAIGRHKLIPWLSPGKSVEGLIGAILFGSLITYGLVSVLPKDSVISALSNLGTFKLILLGGCLAIVGQLGDLSESLLKRDANMKDSASFIPEFGGFCDLLDSVLPAGFIWFWMLKLIL